MSGILKIDGIYPQKMNLADKNTIVKLMRRRKPAITGTIIFLFAAFAFFFHSIFTTVEVSGTNGIGGTTKYRSPLFLTDLGLYYGIFIALLICSWILIVFSQYSLSKAIQLYLEKTIGNISRNEFRNAKKAILKGIKNGFMGESLNELPQENTQQFP
jgi:hypothetical protein